jgi:hypothetical protein
MAIKGSPLFDAAVQATAAWRRCPSLTGDAATFAMLAEKMGALTDQLTLAEATSTGAVELRANGDGIQLLDPGVIPWDQAVAVGRQIIKLARARGDVS